MPRKSVDRVEIKDADQGIVRLVFATLNVKDSDGDVTQPGAFGEQKVRISAYNHASWNPGYLPVGKGTIHEEADEAIFDGQFFLNTQVARDTFETVKEMEDLQEWSYGYDVIAEESGSLEGEPVNFLKRLKVHEVSPVILGAGVNTRTLVAKGKQLQSEVAQRLDEAGGERWGGANTYVYVRDYDPDEGYAIFCVYSRDLNDERYLRVGYTRSADGEVALGAEETEVEPQVSYEAKAEPDEPKVKDPDEPETKGAIASHSTATTDEAWSASTNVGRLPSPLPVAKARAAYAWIDSAEITDGELPKSAAKFPHHMVSADGNPGAANLRACSSIIAILNGGRGGASIPDSDRQGVYRHAARHLKDGGRDVPELSSGEPGTTKLSDHLAWATAEVEVVTERLADVVASRTEKGKDLGDASREAAAELEARLKALREVLASAAENDADAAVWGEGLEIEDELVRARS